MAKEIGNRIVIDEKIMHGKPVIKGTRIPVYIVLNQKTIHHSLFTLHKLTN